MAQYNADQQIYRSLLDKKLRTTAWNIGVLAMFMGLIGGAKSMFEPVSTFGQDRTKLKPTGQPIEVLRDFEHQGGLTMDIPVFYPLVAKPTYGEQTLVGKGESARWGVMQVAINQFRHAYKLQDTKMSKQALQKPEFVNQLMRKATDYLGDYFNRWLAFQPYLAILEGFSENLSVGKELGGLGKTKKSHMNTYVVGSGRVTYSDTHATYEAAVATALNGLGATDVFSTKVIQNMVYAAQHEHRIQPLKMDGMLLYPIIISDAQALQLAQDTTWENRMQHAAEKSLSNNPVFTGKVAGIYGGAILIVDNTIPSAYISGDSTGFVQGRATLASGGVCYLNADTDGLGKYMETPVDPGARKPAILLGKSAIGCGIASDINFDDEYYDFKQKHEVGADMIIGFQRADILDTDGHFGKADNARVENTSSLVCFSYSPSAGTW